MFKWLSENANCNNSSLLRDAEDEDDDDDGDDDDDDVVDGSAQLVQGVWGAYHSP